MGSSNRRQALGHLVAAGPAFQEVFAPLTSAERETLHALLVQAVQHIASACPQGPTEGCEDEC